MSVEQQAIEEMRDIWAHMKDALERKADEATIRKLNARIDQLEVAGQRVPLTGARSGDLGTPDPDLQLWVKMVVRGGAQFLDTADERTRAERYKSDAEAKLKIGPNERKALAIGDDTTGGFLAPPELANEIIKGVQLISPVRAYARVRKTNNRSVMAPTRSGVFAAKWIGETGNRVETQGLAYSMEEIPTSELYALVIASNQDLEDSVFDLAGDIADNAAEQFAKAEGKAFVRGDASQKQPQGFLIDDQTPIANIVVDPMGTGGASTLTADGIIAFLHNLKSDYARRATWFMNRKTVGAIRLLKDSQNRYLWEPNYQVGAPPTILGVPYAEVPDMPDVAANNLPIALGDWSRAYWIVDRVDMQVQTLKELFAQQGQIGFLVRKRVGGQVVLPEAIRLLKVSIS